MGKLANAMVAVSIMLSGVAHAGGRHERWKAVQDLAPGVLVDWSRSSRRSRRIAGWCRRTIPR